MSRAFVAFYMGDYQKKTQHLDTLQHGAYFLLLQHCWTHGALPPEPAGRAAIARLPLAQWKKIAPVVNAFFDPEGRNKRATEEIEKSERISLQRAMAGRKGGYSSGTSKAIARGKQESSKTLANDTRSLKQPARQIGGISEAIQNPIITSTFSGTARDNNSDLSSGGSLATAQLGSALREPPMEQQGDPLAGMVAMVRAGHPPGRPFWVDWDTPEWRAHEHWRRARAWKPPSPIKRMVDNVELTGNWFEDRVPRGYDEATGERIDPSEENAA